MTLPIASEDDGASNMTFQELLDTLYSNRELLVTVPTEQVRELKDGLQALKSRTNYAIRQKGGIPPSEMLAFLEYPAKDNEQKVIDGQTVVHIRMKPRKSVDILNIAIPDGTI